jgi:N-acetylglucosamine-6-sulfatase
MFRSEFLKRAAFGLGALSLGLGYQREAEAIPPNILLIVPDDLPKRGFHTREVMPKLFARMVDRGLEYELGFTTHPLCCPARWSMMTGLYAHNHGVWVIDTCTENARSKGLLGDTTATRLSSAGYRVGHFGKYNNGYQRIPTYLPPGYSRDAWMVLASAQIEEGNSSWNEYGTIRNRAAINSTQHITDATVRFIEEGTGPFFATTAYLSPHYPYNPSSEHAHDFDTDPFEILPSRTTMSSREVSDMTAVQRGKKEELRDVDDGIERIFAALEATGKLENTYIIYVADNGEQLGEHDTYEKDKPWRESTEIPFVGSTICDLAGVPWQDWDGRSLVPTFDGTIPLDWRKHLLIEDAPKKWRSLRTEEYMYVHMYGSATWRLFDTTTLDSDPEDTYEMTNLISTPEGIAVKADYQPRLNALSTCRGATCRAQEA